GHYLLKTKIVSRNKRYPPALFELFLNARATKFKSCMVIKQLHFKKTESLPAGFPTTRCLVFVSVTPS
ncbi:hypothetical protein, partial [Ochrobactrum sp. SFR4]|uniref:hypothetical protein n=1 Tax=Ochrobactrum sp. SFR4 TaxID=2717368 RepID=UPI001C8B82D8